MSKKKTSIGVYRKMNDAQSLLKSSRGYIYIVQTPEFFDTNVYKVGKSLEYAPTVKVRRLSDYPKGSRIHFLTETAPGLETILEKLILNEFRQRYEKIKGNEWFSGNLAEMKDIILRLSHQIDSPEDEWTSVEMDVDEPVDEPVENQPETEPVWVPSSPQMVSQVPRLVRFFHDILLKDSTGCTIEYKATELYAAYITYSNDQGLDQDEACNNRCKFWKQIDKLKLKRKHGFLTTLHQGCKLYLFDKEPLMTWILANYGL